MSDKAFLTRQINEMDEVIENELARARDLRDQEHELDAQSLEVARAAREHERTVEREQHLQQALYVERQLIELYEMLGLPPYIDKRGEWSRYNEAFNLIFDWRQKASETESLRKHNEVCVARIEELEAEVARLSAGTDQPAESVVEVDAHAQHDTSASEVETTGDSVLNDADDEMFTVGEAS